MNGKLFGFVLLAIIGLAGLGVIGRRQTDRVVDETEIRGESAAAAIEQRGWQSQTRTMGAVEVEVTPIKLEPGQEPVFEVSLNTHSVDLGYDFTAVFSLIDDQGGSYAVQDWSGGAGGHHLTGQLRFEPLAAGDWQRVTLVAAGINDQTAEFTWNR